MIIREVLLGAALGFINGLTGAGGAALALPGMVFLLGTSTVNAVATTFPFTVVLRVFGSYQHLRQGSIHRGVSVDLLIGSVPGAAIGVFLISSLIDRFGDRLNDWLNLAIGLLLLATIAVSHRARRSKKSTMVGLVWKGRNVSAILAALLTGVAIGATSVGGGSLLIALMLLLYRITPAQIVGSSIAVSLVLMVVGTVGFWSEGLADLRLAWHLSIGGVPGVLLGSIMTMRVSPRLLAQVVTLAIGVAGLSLAVQGALSLAGGD